MYVTAGEPSGKATVSLICGVFFFVLPSALCAVIFGHLALSEIKRSGGRLIGEGRAVAGLVLGYLGLAGIPFILIIAAIAIPNLLRSRIAGNEASAVGGIREINVAESTYTSAYPEVGFACALENLGGKQTTPNSANAGLIDERLATGIKSGYRYRLEDCEVSDHAITRYRVSAVPVTPGTTGMRAFCSDQTGVIRFIRGTAEECFDSGTPLQ
jgi:type IV pilus assembly protein PilA